MSAALFARLRELTLEQLVDCPSWVRSRSDAVPIEQTVDGWYCLLGSGVVAHLAEGVGDETESDRRSVALVGSLAMRIPLATWFLRCVSNAVVCEHCAGAGSPRGLDEPTVRLTCSCGGLGWTLAVDSQEKPTPTLP